MIRRRAVGDGFHEELTILNHDDEPVDLTVRIEAATDFADLFEVKDALEKKGTYSRAIDDGRAACSPTERDTFERDDGDLVDARPREIDENGLTFAVRLEPHGDVERPSSTSTPTMPRRRCEVAPRPAPRGASAETMAAGPRRAGSSDAPRARVRLGAAHRAPTGGASSTSRRCASRR